MQALKTRPGVRRGGILYLRTEDIAPSPVQPRQYFDDDALKELSDSIRNYGILNPLTLRLRGGRYELVAGERRLRAAKLAGLREVPCILLDVNMEDAGLIALIENLQRKDLDYIEEARGIQQLIQMFGMSQEEAARRIGRSQSAVANKLRLLRLPEAEEQRAALDYILEHDLTVAATDAYVETLLSAPKEEASPPPPQRKRTFILKDVRLFLNSLTRNIEVMKQGGIDAGLRREETPDALILTISIPKQKEAT